MINIRNKASSSVKIREIGRIKTNSLRSSLSRIVYAEPVEVPCELKTVGS